MLAPLLPRGLEADTYDGSAWLGVVPFHMTDVSPRGVPRIRKLGGLRRAERPHLRDVDGKPGVWFFSLDATQPLAVRIARAVFHLPYLDARIESDAMETRSSTRSVPDTSGRRRCRACRLVPADRAGRAERPGSLEEFLTERYCLYSANRKGRVYRSEVDHARWPLQPAEATIELCSMTRPLGIDLQPEPLLAPLRLEHSTSSPGSRDVSVAERPLRKAQ